MSEITFVVIIIIILVLTTVNVVLKLVWGKTSFTFNVHETPRYTVMQQYICIYAYIPNRLNRNNLFLGRFMIYFIYEYFYRLYL